MAIAALGILVGAAVGVNATINSMPEPQTRTVTKYVEVTSPNPFDVECEYEGMNGCFNGDGGDEAIEGATYVVTEDGKVYYYDEEASE